MSVKMALAKLSAAAAGGTLLVGGAVHVAEPQAATTSYKSIKSVKQVKRPRVVKQKKKTPKVVKRIRRIIDRPFECGPGQQIGPDGKSCYAMALAPVPYLPPMPTSSVSGGAGGGEPIVIGGGSSGFGGGFGGGFFGGFGGSSSGNVNIDLTTSGST